MIANFRQAPPPVDQNANVAADKGSEEGAKKLVNDFFAKMKEGSREGVYQAFNSFLSDRGWDDFISQCETIPANKNKGHIRLLQEGRLQELWSECAWPGRFDYEIKSIKRLNETEFEVEILLTDSAGQPYDFNRLTVKYQPWGEYQSDEWDFFWPVKEKITAGVLNNKSSRL